MKTLLASASLVFLTMGLAVGQDDEAVKKDKELLKGIWKIESFESSQGNKDDFVGATIEFKADGSAEFTKDNDTKKATFTINPAGKPKEIDLKPEGKDESMLGIYRVEKEMLTICIVEGQGNARPNEFAAKDRNVLVKFKKVSK
jgi:uncharacterized protein (TIGR03067 family)